MQALKTATAAFPTIVLTGAMLTVFAVPADAGGRSFTSSKPFASDGGLGTTRRGK